MLNTIFIVDDDPAVARALEAVGRHIAAPVRSFSSVELFLTHAPVELCGCLILDLMLQGQSGLELLRELRARGQELPVIIISGHATVALAVEAMQLGAMTVLEKPFRLGELTQQIETAFQRDAVQRQERVERDDARLLVSRLTARERETLLLIARGYSNKQISAELGLSVRAVEDRRARLMRRLDARSVAEALRLLQRAGLPEEDDT